MPLPHLLLISASNEALPSSLAQRLDAPDWCLNRCQLDSWRQTFTGYSGAKYLVWLGSEIKLPDAFEDLVEHPSLLAVVTTASTGFQRYSDNIPLLHWPRNATRLESLLRIGFTPFSRTNGCSIEGDNEAPNVNFIGCSLAFKRLTSLIHKIAPYDATVLIEGETGTGKEMVARALHYLGARRNAAFVPVNCGAVPENLIETELFGHVRGAFTDAKSTRRGLVALAHKGTLFLDEVDSLSPRTQVALLRFLQEKEYRPVGSEQLEHADVRVIAATNSHLTHMVAKGQFRGDLLFRLNVLNIQVPPLRQRPEDIPLLAERFLLEFRERYNKAVYGFTDTTIEQLCNYHWPGNVRELENVVHRELLMAEHPWLSITLADPNNTQVERRGYRGDRRLRRAMHLDSFTHAKESILQEFEHAYLVGLMLDTHGNVSQAARRAGKERRAFGRLLKKHNISRDTFQS